MDGGVNDWSEYYTHISDDSKKSRECRQICAALLGGAEGAKLPSLTEEFREEATAESDVPNCPLLLGIDIGTTSISISAQVVASDSGVCVQTYNFDHNAAISVDGYPDALGSITGIGLHNFTPESLSAGVLWGIIDELYGMYTAMKGEAMHRVSLSRAMLCGKIPLFARSAERCSAKYR